MTEQNGSDEWLAQLAGRKPAHPDSEVMRLRRIMIESEARLHRRIDATHENEEQAVLRLRRSLESAHFPQRSIARRWGPPLALAASVLVAAAFFLEHFDYLQRISEPGSTVPFGHRIAPQARPYMTRIAVSDPYEAARSLRDELDHEQILSHLSSDEGRYYLFVEVQSSAAVIGRELVEGGIALKPGGNRIEIVPTESDPQ